MKGLGKHAAREGDIVAVDHLDALGRIVGCRVGRVSRTDAGLVEEVYFGKAKGPGGWKALGTVRVFPTRASMDMVGRVFGVGHWWWEHADMMREVAWAGFREAFGGSARKPMPPHAV